MKLSLHSVAGIITSGLNSKNAKSIPIRLVEPYTAVRHFSVSETETTQSLAEILHNRFPFRSVGNWQQRIQDGHFFVNGTPFQGGKLRENDRVSHHSPGVVEPAVPDLVECVRMESDWSVWFKPAPLPMHAGGRYLRNTFQVLAEQLAGKPVYAVHRLDSVTSGLILTAHSAEMAETLSEEFRAREVEKNYVAVVLGIPLQKNWTCVSPIRRKQGFVFETHPEGQKAETNFSMVETDGEKSLIHCKPITGRTHQIRLHLRETGFPVWDDPVYGPHVAETSDKTLQNTAISLVHAGFSIPSLKIKCSLFDELG